MQAIDQHDELDLEQEAEGRETRLPAIDQVTFAALNSLDGFLGRALLSRQEHVEAKRSLRHMVQTVEVLQASVKELQRQNCELQNALNDLPEMAETIPGNGSTIISGAGGQVFRSFRMEP
jgi:hypothetical protein